MNVEFWGVRGTFPSPGKEKVKYGGHTPCASIVSRSGETMIVDAGTGLKDLGDDLISRRGRAPIKITLFLTHFHLDHVMGFPFFAPLFFPEAEITVYAPALPEETQRYLGGLISGRYFPLELFETKAVKVYKEIPRQEIVLGSVRVTHCPLRHPQGSLAYRFEEDGKSFVMATDTEHPEAGIDERLAAFARDADGFVYDATFTPDEYRAGKQGWGHSTGLEGTRLAQAAGVGTLWLSHWNPDHGDRQVDELTASARRLFRRTSAARQGLRMTVK